MASTDSTVICATIALANSHETKDARMRVIDGTLSQMAGTTDAMASPANRASKGYGTAKAPRLDIAQTEVAVDDTDAPAPHSNMSIMNGETTSSIRVIVTYARKRRGRRKNGRMRPFL